MSEKLHAKNSLPSEARKYGEHLFDRDVYIGYLFDGLKRGMRGVVRTFGDKPYSCSRRR
jgi:hypothetical protein